jgi:hypothetical protein
MSPKPTKNGPILSTFMKIGSWRASPNRHEISVGRTAGVPAAAKLQNQSNFIQFYSKELASPLVPAK